MKIIVTFFLLLSQFANAQLSWTNYNTGNSGIYDNVGITLAVDKFGNIWTSSGYNPFDGIQKFDGNVWTTYNTLNSGIPENDVRALAIDTNNVIWIGTYSSGLARFDGTNWTVFDTSNSDIISPRITTLMVDKFNRLWIGCAHYGVSVYDGVTFKNLTATNSGLPSNMCVVEMLMDDSLDTWFALSCGQGVARLNHADSTWLYITGLPSSEVSSIAMDNLNRLWIGYGLGFAGVSRFDSSGMTNFTPFTSGFNWANYECIKVDQDNNVWVGVRGDGLIKYDGNNWNNFVPPMSSVAVACNLIIDQFDRILYREQYTGLWVAQLPTVINEFTNDERVSVYPNPVSEMLNIIINQPSRTKIEIRNILGKEIFSGYVSESQTSVDTKSMPSGIYFLSAKTTKGVVTKKIVKD